MAEGSDVADLVRMWATASRDQVAARKLIRDAQQELTQATADEERLKGRAAALAALIQASEGGPAALAEAGRKLNAATASGSSSPATASGSSSPATASGSSSPATSSASSSPATSSASSGRRTSAAAG